MRGGMLDPGSAADAAGAAASLRCSMCDDACMEAFEGLQAPAEEARRVKEDAKQQDQLNSLLEPSWPGAEANKSYS